MIYQHSDSPQYHVSFTILTDNIVLHQCALEITVFTELEEREQGACWSCVYDHPSEICILWVPQKSHNLKTQVQAP